MSKPIAVLAVCTALAGTTTAEAKIIDDNADLRNAYAQSYEPVTESPAVGGFDWGDAAIGGGTVLLLAMGAGGVALASQRRGYAS
jgi:hypothetical protein